MAFDTTAENMLPLSCLSVRSMQYYVIITPSYSTARVQFLKRSMKMRRKHFAETRDIDSSRKLLKMLINA